MLFLFPVAFQAQHRNKIDAVVNYELKTINVKQQIIFINTTGYTLNEIILNDWNNAYSDKTTPLGKRFSDEFIRSFHRENDDDRGKTIIHSIANQFLEPVSWNRPEGHPDLIAVKPHNPVLPNERVYINLEYEIKIPDDKFTRYGYGKDIINLNDWYLVPARFENGEFVKYSNENLDDIANSQCIYEVKITAPDNLKITTDLQETDRVDTVGSIEYYYYEKNSRSAFNLVIESTATGFEIYRNTLMEVHTNLKDVRVSEIQKASLIDKIVKFSAENLGKSNHSKIMVTQVDYDKNPVYGLNQLPAFIAPFPDSFLYEIKFLKTYLNNYIKNNLKLDPRKDNWVYDGIQMYLIMKYIDENHPEKTMMGLQWGILKGYNLFKTDYNSQFSYLYLVMARKNLDQPIGDAKDTFIKFNEQIAGKYKAGLGLHYLDTYYKNDVVKNTITEFFELNKERQTTDSDFRTLLDNKSGKDNDWFFNTIINSRDIIDYGFGRVRHKGDSLLVTIKNKTGANAPISLYAKNNNETVFLQWIENTKKDTVLSIPANNIEKLVLNYNNEVPEFNRRDNWKKVKGFFPNNRPIKFTFFQDLENPAYNQVFYVPNFIFNLYDGIAPGLRFHNKSLIDKPFIFDIAPMYSPRTQSLIGSASFLYNQYVRDEGSLYNIRYGLSGSTYHYAEDAAYIKFTPSIQFRFRDEDLRKNKKQFFLIRNVLVDREKSRFVETTDQNESYSVFNLRYSGFESEITRHINYFIDSQVSANFGKLSGEFQFRRLFYNNRQVNLRFYAGMFMYRSTSSEYFSFGLDRPTDYMFDYNLYGRSETTGIYSQQYVMAEGGFKSKLDTRYANQWMTTVNASFNVWNWIEVYGDAGLLKNHYSNAEFVYDSGLRLNLVPDYFELYFPVYSSNGFEMNNGNYNEKIRFVVTISPGALIGLFTRKWF